MSQTPFTGIFTFGTNGNVTSFPYNGTPILNLTVSDLTKVNLPTTSSAGNFRSTGFPLDSGSGTLSGTFDPTKYFEFTLTPSPGYTFSLNSLNFGAGRSGTGPRSFLWRSSADSYASTINSYSSLGSSGLFSNTAGVISFTGDSTATTGTNIVLALSGSSAAYTGLNTLTLRFYGFNSEQSGGTGGLQGPLTFAGAIVGSGGSAFTWSGGAGNWENGQAGNFGQAYANSSTATATFTGSGDVVTVTGTVEAATMTVDTAGYAFQGGTISLANAAVAINAGTTEISSIVSGANGLVKSGSGALILSAANTYTGLTNVTSGTLAFAADSALGDLANDLSMTAATLKTTASVALGSGRDFTGSGTLDIAPGTTLTSNGSFNLTSTTLSNSGTLDLQGATRSVGSLTFGTAAVVNGSGAIAATGLTATSVTSGSAVVNPAITFSSGDKTVDVGSGGALVLNGDIAGTSGRIAKTGAGTLIASGSNSTSGFRVGASAATPTNGGTVILTAAAASGTGQLQLNFGTLETTAPFTFANGLSIGGRSNGVAVLGGTNAITFSGSSGFFRGTSTSGELRLDVNNVTTLSRLGPTSGGGTATGVTFGGTGRLILAGDGTGFADTVTMQSGLTLELANATSLASATLDTTTGTIVYGVASTALGGITGSGNLALPSTSLSVGGNNASTTYSGQFSGAGGLVKTGSGSLTLSAANGHSGGTTLSAGTLVAANAGAFGSGTVAVGGGTLDLGGLAVPNAIAMTVGALTGGAAYAGTIGVGGLAAFAGTVGGTVNVAASGTLAGNGTSFIGPVTFVTGATHAPGSSPGAQTFTGGLVYDPGSALNWELWGNTASAGDAGTLYDSIIVTTGSLSIGSTAALNLIFSGTGSTVDWSDPFWTTDRSWTVISAAAAGSSTGVFALGTVGNDQQGDALTAVLPNASFNVTRSASGDIVLNFVAVPEPSALALAGLGLLSLTALAARKWRR